MDRGQAHWMEYLDIDVLCLCETTVYTLCACDILCSTLKV